MFKTRSHKKELLDADHIQPELLHQNLKELEVINRLLGGHAISIKGLSNQLDSNKKTVVADIGCGGGDSLKAFAHFFRQNKVEGDFIGIDLKADCIDFAKKACENFSEIRFIQEDYKTALEKLPEVTHVHAALFCHHLSESEIVELIQFCIEHKKTLIINDLERNALAYWSIWGLTRLLGGSSLVQNDAPLSVLRGFKKREWKVLLQKAGATSYSVSWQWAFRHLIVVKHA